MGRKPNALIIQHFDRGPKLNDSSNRYEHTCKSCGEKFPKGRIDSLTSHLIKKCPALSINDRQKVLLEMNNLPHLPEGTRGESSMNGSAVVLPIGQPPRDNWSALGILAEVARRNDTNEKHDSRSADNQGLAGGNQHAEPAQLRLEIQEHYTPENPPVSYEQRVQHGRKLGKLYTHEDGHDRENSLVPANFAAQAPHSRSVTPNLAMATNATNMAAAAARFVPSMVDPQLLGDDLNEPNNTTAAKSITEELTEESSSFHDNLYPAMSGEPGIQWPMLDGSGVSVGHYEADHVDQNLHEAEPPRVPTYTPLAPSVAMQTTMVTQFSAETGRGRKPAKPVGRKKFEKDRRKEVQIVRKLGACLRCRMLKKPCSPGTPCDTCQRVENARVWKQPCVRTRLAEELDMYSAGLHIVLAHQQVGHAKSQVSFQNSPYHIEASHYPDTTVYATFNAQEGHQITAQEEIDPSLSGEFNVNSLRILDTENDDPPMKLEAYMKRMSSVFIEREPSHFMNVTLNTAQKIALENQDELVDKTDGLLTKTLEFWAIVQILVDHEPRWVISERVDVDAPPGQGPVATPTSYDLLVAQLNAAAEKKASKMCSDVLSRLERLLLQKVNSFEVFLISIIILNCIEKSTWLFKSWEQASFRSRWPLDKPPRWFADQGEKFTETLQMLLRMRDVVPKTVQTPEGTIASNKNTESREYFEALNLDLLDVLNKQANHQFNPANSRCYELRFCSRILLPTPN